MRKGERMIYLSILLFVILWMPAVWAKVPKKTGLVQRGVMGWEQLWKKVSVKASHMLHLKQDGLKARRKKFQLEQAMRDLYPLSHPEEKAGEFKHQRNQYVFYVLLLACLFAGFSALDSLLDTEPEGNMLLRSPPGGTQRALDLEAMSEEGRDFGKVNIKLEPRQYTTDELESLYAALLPVLEKTILNGNPDVDHVYGPLYLPEMVSGYPFSLKWSSGDYTLMDDSGNFMKKSFKKEGEALTLSVKVSVQDFQTEYAFPVVLRNRELSAEEIEHQDFLETVNVSLAKDPAGEKAHLPANFREYTLLWKKSAGNMAPMILGMGVVIAVLMGAARESNLEEQVKERDRQLLCSYPDFVNKLSLYMGAGMSISSCLYRIASEKRHTDKGERESYLQEELRYTVNELSGGVSEREAIEGLGKRCRLPCYIKLTTLLAQNLRKGGNKLLPRLKEEAEDAFAMRKNLAREAGERAGTKLIFPMLLMMGVVMIVIIVPAFSGFQG